MSNPFQVGDRVRRRGRKQGRFNAGDEGIVVRVVGGQCQLEGDVPGIRHGCSNLQLVVNTPAACQPAPNPFVAPACPPAPRAACKPVEMAAAYGASTSEQLEVAERTVAELKAKKKAEEQAAKEAAKVEAEAEAAQQARNALAERIYYERGLAHATINLLVTIENVELHGGAAELNPVLATYRSELAPLAATYGFKIVLVGDKTVGVLTK